MTDRHFTGTGRELGTIDGDDATVRPVEIHVFAIGGMTCAACAGRVERKLNKVDGVVATVNLATERARVAVPSGTDPRSLAKIVERAGYTARPLPPAQDLTGGGAATRTHDLRRRLAVAAVLAMPLADLSLALSLFPELRFAGWEWVFLGLALPMVLWCGWPFHRAAWLAARRGGIPKVLIPEENVKDLAEIPDRITDGVEIVPVSHVDEVLAHALVRAVDPIEWTEADDLASQPRGGPPFAESGQTTH